MADYLFYVLPDGVDDRAMRGEVPLDHAASDQLLGRGVRAGDTLWIVRCPAPNKLELVGRIVVGRITTHADAEATLGRTGLYQRALSDAPDQFVLAKEGTLDRVRIVDISGIALLLRFERGAASRRGSHSDRLPPRFTGQHLQTLRILSSDSAVTIERCWERARH